MPPLSLYLSLSLSRAVKRTVNGQARKRARGSPRRHLTLPLGEEVLLPLFEASPTTGSRFIACLDRPTPRQIKALNITGAGKRPENYSRSRVRCTKNLNICLSSLTRYSSETVRQLTLIIYLANLFNFVIC